LSDEGKSELADFEEKMFLIKEKLIYIKLNPKFRAKVKPDYSDLSMKKF